MMIVVRIIILPILVLSIMITNVYATFNEALTTDSRIRTYVYTPNEVFLLLLHYGFQSYIEFDNNEKVQNYTVGDEFAWKIRPLGNKLFINPMERNIRTNMTIITNKRTYQFDLVARELINGNEKDLVYVIRFKYPKKKKL